MVLFNDINRSFDFKEFSVQDTEKRFEILDNIKDQLVLYKIALEDPNPSIRVQALEKIDEPDILEMLVLGYDVDLPGEKLLEMIDHLMSGKLISDASFYFSVTDLLYRMTETSDKSRTVKVVNLREQARKKVQKLIRQTSLRDFALTADDPHFKRILAMVNQSKLRNQDILETIMSKDVDEGVKEEIIPFLTNQKFLKKIVLEEKSTDLRIVAANILNDQNFIIDVALNGTDDFIRAYATSKIENQSLLENIFNDTEDELIKIACVIKLENKELLETIALNDDLDEVRSIAVQRLGKLGHDLDSSI